MTPMRSQLFVDLVSQKVAPKVSVMSSEDELLALAAPGLVYDIALDKIFVLLDGAAMPDDRQRWLLSDWLTAGPR